MMKRAMNYRQKVYKICACIVLLAFMVTSVNVSGHFACPGFSFACSWGDGPFKPWIDPPNLKGIKVHPDNPFDLILSWIEVDQAVMQRPLEQSKISNKLIKYFLASLTIPEKDLWVTY